MGLWWHIQRKHFRDWLRAETVNRCQAGKDYSTWKHFYLRKRKEKDGWRRHRTIEANHLEDPKFKACYFSKPPLSPKPTWVLFTFSRFVSICSILEQFWKSSKGHFECIFGTCDETLDVVKISGSHALEHDFQEFEGLWKLVVRMHWSMIFKNSRG